MRRRTQYWQRFTSGFCCYRTLTFNIQPWNAYSNNKKKIIKNENELPIIDPILAQAKNQKRQLPGSLIRHGFAYGGRYKYKQAAKAVSGVIKAATNAINNIAGKRTIQIISEGGKESDCVLTKILPGTTEDVYLTPFTHLGEFFYLSFITWWKHFQTLHKPLKTLLSKIISIINYS